jgi:phosphoribosylformylglycinamidine synthase
VGEVPLHELCDEAPTYRRKGEPSPPPRGPARSELPRLSIEEGLLRLLARPMVASKRWVYRQFDHQVQLGTVVKPGADAAVLRVKETGQLMALTVDGCSLGARDWKACGAQAVAEAARNLTAVGAQPIGVTNCLNFGNPTDPKIYAQLEGAIEGIAEACEIFGVPVTGGNVSLYNEGGRGAIPPTPVIGMVGLIEKVEHVMTPGWKAQGDVIYLVGLIERAPIAMGEYWDLLLELAEKKAQPGSPTRQSRYGDGAAAVPHLDLKFERRLQEAVREAIRGGLVQSCHDVSEGGLGVALAESCLLSVAGFGAKLLELPREIEAAEAELFSEQPSRFVVSVRRDLGRRFEEYCRERDVKARRLGEVAATGILEWEGGARLPLEDLRRAHETLPWE